jgi:hypothetical protein
LIALFSIIDLVKIFPDKQKTDDFYPGSTYQILFWPAAWDLSSKPLQSYSSLSEPCRIHWLQFRRAQIHVWTAGYLLPALPQKLLLEFYILGCVPGCTIQVREFISPRAAQQNWMKSWFITFGTDCFYLYFSSFPKCEYNLFVWVFHQFNLFLNFIWLLKFKWGE